MKSSPMVTTPPTEAESESPSLIFLSLYPVWVKATVSWPPPQRGDGFQGRKNWSPKGGGFFWDFILLFFRPWICVQKEQRVQKQQTNKKSQCFFCLVVVVVAKGVDFLGEDFIQNKCRLLWRSGLKWLDLWPTPLKSNMTLEMEHHHLLIGDTSSNGCFSIVMLVFGGCTLIFVLRTAVPVWQSSFPSWPPN